MCIRDRIGDIALVLYVLLYDDEKMGLGTVKAQKAFIDKSLRLSDQLACPALSDTPVSYTHL